MKGLLIYLVFCCTLKYGISVGKGESIKNKLLYLFYISTYLYILKSALYVYGKSKGFKMQ